LDVDVGTIQISFLPLPSTRVHINHHVVVEINLLDVNVLIVLTGRLSLLSCQLFVSMFGLVQLGDNPLLLFVYLLCFLAEEPINYGDYEEDSNQYYDDPDSHFVLPEIVL
jgi:hypothetical protein